MRFEKKIFARGSYASEAKSGVPSEAEEAYSRLTASIAQWYKGWNARMPQLQCVSKALSEWHISVAQAKAGTQPSGVRHPPE